AFTFYTPNFRAKLLTGTDGFRYDLDCDGEVDSGGTTDGTLKAFGGAFILSVNGTFAGSAFGGSYDCYVALPAAPTDRGLTYASVGYGALRVSRKTFVPDVGGFVRYLEVFSNPTGSPIKAGVEVSSFLCCSESTIATAPRDTGNTYALTNAPGSATLGFVFSGNSPSVPVTSTNFAPSNKFLSYRWDITVPAGQTAILMHFGLQHNPADLAGAQSQASALVNLTDPNALTGMSDAEKSAVVNFTVPIGTGALQRTPLDFSGGAYDWTGRLWDSPSQAVWSADCGGFGLVCIVPENDVSSDTKADSVSVLQGIALVQPEQRGLPSFSKFFVMPNEEK
ncbi:MAG TPA: hypothetical protein VKE71_05110, partial [Candidatus Angelobacter sp.]|nr:hypothetical protein [Candidatus Angelobacter sp.]